MQTPIIIWLRIVKNPTSSFVFLKDAESTEIDVTLAPAKSNIGFKIEANHIIDTNDESAAVAYAKMKDIIWTKYSFSEANPTGFWVMAEPQFGLFSKAKFYQSCI